MQAMVIDDIHDVTGEPAPADAASAPAAAPVAAGVRRITAPNPGPFTAAGTNTYIVGSGRVAVVDPGPAIAAHVEALLAATAGERITHIFLTHTHRDHSGAIPALVAATGATVLSGGPHRAARPLADGEAGPSDEADDTGHRPNRVLADGEEIAGDGWRITAIATPGHTANHLAFALRDPGLVFPGDHVMGWSTTIVAPPDGAMGDYMRSLDRLAARPERLLLPGHGPPVADGHARIDALRRHRQGREAAILDRLAAGDARIAEIVAAVYRDLDPRLRDAAALSVLAHIEDLAARGLVANAGPPGIGGLYRPAGAATR